MPSLKERVDIYPTSTPPPPWTFVICSIVTFTFTSLYNIHHLFFLIAAYFFCVTLEVTLYLKFKLISFVSGFIWSDSDSILNVLINICVTYIQKILS